MKKSVQFRQAMQHMLNTAKSQANVRIVKAPRSHPQEPTPVEPELKSTPLPVIEKSIVLEVTKSIEDIPSFSTGSVVNSYKKQAK